MSFLKKMFGKKNPIDEMRQLMAQKNWAGLLSLTKRIDRSEMDEALQAEITALEREAGDALATINLEEGAWAQKSGNLLRAREDYQLALEQARSDELRARIDQALAALDRGELPSESAVADDRPAVHAGCNSSCTTTTAAAVNPQEMDLDEEARLELLLATLPAEMAERYLAASPMFRQAWLATQDGDEEQAQTFLNQVPEAEHNALFLFERGALMTRSGQYKKAYQDLRAALTIEPNLFAAFDTLVDVLIASGRIDELEALLRQHIANERFSGYCWARLANMHAQRKELELALAAGLKAVDEGIVDQGLFSLCAELMEQAERFDEAEALLKRLPAGGCGGGAHPLLAEFWLRRGQNFNQSLESFKGAMRQERDNPRWLLRISQVYLAKGWRKEAAEQVECLMRQEDLPEQIRAEVRLVADQLQRI